MSYDSREDLFNKVDWEGGMEGSLEYGLRLEDVPPHDKELLAAWTEMQAAWDVYKPLGDKVYDLLEAGTEEER